MFSAFWILMGFIFSVGMVFLTNWLDNETKIEVSIFTMMMVGAGTALGGITVLFVSVMGIMMLGEDKRFKDWVNKPRTTFQIKKDKNNE